MNEQASAETAEDACRKKLAELTERQGERDALWLKMSAGDTSGAARFRELRGILDELRADYRKTCGELSETSDLPRSILQDWH